MMRVIDPSENIFNAVEAVVEHGFAAIEGTKTIAVPICERVIKALKPYKSIEAVQSYQNVANRGYLYLVVDIERYDLTGGELRAKVDELDRLDPG
jgi:hypothetical protein